MIDSTTYNYPTTSNQLTSINLTSGGTQQRGFLYRANGQAYQDVKVGDATYTYAFDSQGRMVTVTKGSTTLATYAYDAMGRRIKRATTGTGAVSREYVYLPDGRLLTEADGTGATIREYIWLDDIPVAAIDKSGSTVTLYYVHAGHLGQPLAMTNSSKTKVWDAAIEPFGAAKIFTSTKALDLRLPGQQLQAETGLHQNWFRDYDPALGRYLEPDPIGLQAGPSVYGYVDQDPMSATDPAGLATYTGGFGGVASFFLGVNGEVGIYFNPGLEKCEPFAFGLYGTAGENVGMALGLGFNLGRTGGPADGLKGFSLGGGAMYGLWSAGGGRSVSVRPGNNNVSWGPWSGSGMRGGPGLGLGAYAGASATGTIGFSGSKDCRCSK